MRFLGLFISAIAALFAVQPQVNAARDLEPFIATDRPLELVVLTVPNCIYCSVFKRDVEPRYVASKYAATLPLRYLDLNDAAADRLKLKSAVEVVPTFVLLEGNQEVDRISGYIGPDNFFRSIKYMLSLP